MSTDTVDPRRTSRAAPPIRAAGVGKRFNANGAEVVALQGLNVDVRPGEFLSIIGGSGCGKSTFLRIVAGLESGSTSSRSRPPKPRCSAASARAAKRSARSACRWPSMRRRPTRSMPTASWS